MLNLAGRWSLQDESGDHSISMPEPEVSGYFSDSCFSMLPGPSREILFVPSENDFAAAKNTIIIRDLFNCARRKT
ncbi:MAG: hypothetical protein JKX91_10410 [Rhizobiaceae bacterium]|nr:hypothetical protein [Rhizobiaceae bacterium]